MRALDNREDCVQHVHLTDDTETGNLARSSNTGEMHSDRSSRVSNRKDASSLPSPLIYSGSVRCSFQCTVSSAAASTTAPGCRAPLRNRSVRFSVVVIVAGRYVRRLSPMLHVCETHSVTASKKGPHRQSSSAFGSQPAVTALSFQQSCCRMVSGFVSRAGAFEGRRTGHDPTLDTVNAASSP
jgi:hypothetical protein